MASERCTWAVYSDDPDCGAPAPFTTTLRRKADGALHSAPRCETHRRACNDAWEVFAIVKDER